MKKILVTLLCASMLFSMPTIAFAEAKDCSYSWYCKHVKDHIQPQADASLAFVEELDAFYRDKTHTELTDSDRVVYLTFDAGYENGNVAKILDILKDENVPAAFFVLGYLIRHDTALVERMVNEGHLVCNHTVHHKDMSKEENDAFLTELHELEDLCEQYLGQKTAPYYRPPEGRFSRENLECAKENGYKTVFWSFAYPDWNNQKQPAPERAKEIIMENIHNGEVMLLHPTSATNAAILGDVIRELKAQGFRFGTLDELTAGDAS